MAKMLRRTNGRETTTDDERARRAIGAKLHVFSLVFISVFALSTGANAAAEPNESRPARMRRYDANRIDTSEIFELGGYTESRQDRQRELGKKKKKVSYGEDSLEVGYVARRKISY